MNSDSSFDIDERAKLRHDLRTPLNQIIGYSEMLMEDATKPGDTELLTQLRTIREEAKQLLKAIQVRLADSSGRLQRGAFATEIQTSLQTTFAALEAIAPQEDPNLAADIERIRSAANNLVSVAAGHSLEAPGPIAPSKVAFQTRENPRGRLLIVDDDEMNRDVLRRRVERDFYEVVITDNGRDALRLVGESKFDLVLLDIVMPHFDGFQVLAAIKGDARLRDTPVIVISALDDMAGVIRSIEMGAEDYLSRPIDPVLLQARIGAVIARRRSDEQLRQIQNLERLGILAGGIAHVFNNLLTGILGNASWVLEDLPPSSPNRARLEEVVQASERAAQLTAQILAFAGKGKYAVERVHLSTLVSGICDLMRASVPPNVQLNLDLKPNVPQVDADAAQLQQLVMNLVMNGAEAITGDEPGTVTVSTGLREIRKRESLQFRSGEVVDGSYVYLEVKDTGCGMDEATLSQMFDPFFTTKFMGRGLGLAAALGIVSSHKGLIAVSSSLGGGTTLQVLFPESKRRARTTAAPSDLTGKGSVLVVDDEEVVRTTAKAALERHGYSVVLAENGRIAIDIYKKRAPEFAAVILDMIMPEISGEETFRFLRTINRDVPIIISSGYRESEVLRHFGATGVAGFLQKPYTSVKLAQLMRTVLQNPAVAESTK